MKGSEAILYVYRLFCEMAHRFSSCDYMISYHVSRVAYHLSAIKSGCSIVAPAIYAAHDAKALANQTHSGIYVIYNNSYALEKQFWMDIYDILSGKRPYVPGDSEPMDELAQMHINKFESACLAQLGINNSEYIVLGKYNKLRDAVNKIMRLMDEVYFRIQRYGLSAFDNTTSDTKNTTNHDAADTKTQNTVTQTDTPGK